jgi:hypothetical protein
LVTCIIIGEEDFYKQQGRDELKKKLCEENGVNMISKMRKNLKIL